MAFFSQIVESSFFEFFCIRSGGPVDCIGGPVNWFPPEDLWILNIPRRQTLILVWEDTSNNLISELREPGTKWKRFRGSLATLTSSENMNMLVCFQMFAKGESLAKGKRWCSIGENNLGDFWVFSWFFIVFLGLYGVYIIPNWLLKVPGHIAINW